MWEHLGQQLMVSQKVEINYEVAYLFSYKMCNSMT